jgi:hypothetical protein
LKRYQTRRGELLTLLVLQVACGAAEPPPSLTALDEATRESTAKTLEEDAPVAWTEAKRYLAMAKEMEAKGDLEKADRFAILGAIQLKIAHTRAAHAASKKELADAEARKEVLREDIDRVESALKNMELQIERESLRAHLTEVVEKTRLDAAAAEEQEERFMMKKDKSSLFGARFQVGSEMVERASVWRDIVALLMREELLNENETNLVNGPLRLAEDALASGSLADVQRFTEETGVEARRLIDQAWTTTADTRLVVIERALSVLRKGGLSPELEELGPTIGLDADLKNVKKAGWVKNARRLGELIAPLGDIHCLVLASLREGSNPRSAEHESQQLAENVKEALVESGVSETRVHARGAASFTPLAVLGGEGIGAAVLLIPIPKKN